MAIQRKRERHGMSKTPTYIAWAMMLQRCNNEKHVGYDRYGGRGIKVCARWNKSFVAFLEDMGERPDGLTLERIDNDGDYCPENCKWATPAEQARNTRRTRRVVIDGEARIVKEVAEELGLSDSLVNGRLQSGWTVEQALGFEEHYAASAVTINGETMTKAQWAARLGLSRQAVDQRIDRGWPLEEALTTPKGAPRPSLLTDAITGKARRGPRRQRRLRTTRLGEYLTELRLQHEWTQLQVAEMAGISNATVNHYEVGGVKRVRPAVLRKMAGVYGIPLWELWRRTELPQVLTQFNTNGMMDLRKEVEMAMEDRERGTWLQVRLTEDEKGLLAALAEEYGVSISAFVRMMMMHFDEKRPTVAIRFGPKADALATETTGA